MSQTLEIFIMTLTGIGVYYLLVSRVVYPLFTKLLQGPLNKYYANYIGSYMQSVFRSNLEPDPDAAWYIPAYKKIYEMRLPSTSIEQKSQHLTYLKNKKPDPELLDELMDALSKQSDRDFQIKLIELVEEWTKKIKTIEKKKNLNRRVFSPKYFIENWAKAFSTWASGALAVFYIAFRIEDYTIKSIITTSILFCLFMSWPTIKLAANGFIKWSSTAVITAIVLIVLGIYAANNHSIVAQKVFYSKTDPDIKVTIRYPTWLKKDDLSNCDSKRSIIVQVEGASEYTMNFDYDHSLLSIRNVSCNISSAEFNNLESFEFYLSPLTLDTLKIEQEIPFTPQISINGAQEIFPSINLRMEHPFWDLVYQLSTFVAPPGIIGFLLKFLLDKRKNND